MSKQYKRGTRKGTGDTTVRLGINIDTELLPYVNAATNKTRFVNECIRFWIFNHGSARSSE